MINYFELYQLPVSFAPDAAAVKNKYYELSRLYHPDRFATAPDGQRAEALRMAAMNNDAYKVLTNADATMAYILKMHELLQDEEKYSLPPAFLMEMMDINEALGDYELSPVDLVAKQIVTTSLQQQLSDWNAAVQPLTTKYDAEAPDNDLLLQIKDYYFRKKYLLRIQERIDRFAAH